jgi:hypothetical protein
MRNTTRLVLAYRTSVMVRLVSSSSSNQDCSMEEGGSPPPLAASCWRGSLSLDISMSMYTMGAVLVVVGVLHLCQWWCVTGWYIPASYSCLMDGIASGRHVLSLAEGKSAV